MRFATEADIAALPDVVYARLADFPAHEALARRHAVALERVDALDVPGPGMAWAADVVFRGRRRKLAIRITQLVPAQAIGARIEGGNLTAELATGIAPRGAGGSRMSVVLDVRPKGVSGRLILQSLRLIKPTLQKRFAARVAGLARHLSASGPADG